MARVIRNLVWLVAAFGVFIGVVLVLRDSRLAEIGSDYGLFGSLMAALGVLLITPPAMGLIVAVFSLGVEKDRSLLENTGGTRSLRLAKGMKWGGIAMSAGLWAAIIMALRWEEAGLGLWIFTLPLHLMCLYAILVFLLLQAHFDAKTLVAMDWTLRSRSYKWVDLEGLTINPNTQELMLHFTGNRRARLSLYFNHLDEVTAFAKARLEERALARTARS